MALRFELLWRQIKNALKCNDNPTLIVIVSLLLQVFKNCHIYNKPSEDVTVMSQTVEKFYQSKMKAMPPAEAELKGISSAASKPKAKAGGPGSAKKGPSPMSMSSSSGAEGTPTKGRFHSCGCNGLIIIR